VARGARPSRRPCLDFTDAPPAASEPLSLHDALPICVARDRPGGEELVLDPQTIQPIGEIADRLVVGEVGLADPAFRLAATDLEVDRKSTRLNSSHVKNSYAVFCLKKQQKTNHARHTQ